MLGWINLSIESFVVDTFGRDAWVAILEKSGVHKNWVSSCPYSDKITYDLVVTAAGLLGVTVNQALEAYGAYFVKHVQDNGYTNLLHVLGSNVAEFLQNLNNLHLHLSMGWPSMVAPAFRCEQVTPESLMLHYYSSRPGLWPIVVGVLKGMSKEYFGFELGVELVESRDGGADHEVFRLTYPYQSDLRDFEGTSGDAAASLYSMPHDVFYKLHPFHLLVDEDLNVMQAGAGARRVAAGLAPGDRFVQHFKVRHPYVPLDFAAFVSNANTSFLLLARATLVTLKGQMVPVSLPGSGKRALLFLGSPRCSNLNEMQTQKLYLSDIPLYDMSRDFILLAEQRQAEADLKDKFERLTVELKAANEKLARTTKWLEEEKARADALLYRMSGLIACFPAGPERPSNSSGAGGAPAGTATGPERAGSGPSSGAWASGTHLQGSEEGGPLPFGAGGAAADSVAAVAALLRQAGVRAPAGMGDSTAMLSATASAGGGGGVGASLASEGSGTLSASHSRQLHTIDRIEAVRRELAKSNVGAGESDAITCCELLGEGTYGKVYKGLWKGSVVAVKTIVLPAMMSGAEKREKMAIMEAAISSALSHPNILQTYTYDIKPLRDSGGPDKLVMGMDSTLDAVLAGTQGLTGATQGGGGGSVHSFEVRLVLEYCDRGSLREALDKGAYRLAGPFPAPAPAPGAAAGAAPEPPPEAVAAAAALAGEGGVLVGRSVVNYRAVLDTAVDIATAMAHLHGRNVLHADLKARNIMLKSNGAEGRGSSAKVADFGLSVKMDHLETHLSNTFQGTMTHMSPEIMMKGHLSKAGDVYAFGILLWELLTADHVFRKVPKALLGHHITALNKRPEFPAGAPQGYVALAARCWDPRPSRRPTMDQVLAELKALRRDEPLPTPLLAPYDVPPPRAIDGRGNAATGSARGSRAAARAAVAAAAAGGAPLGSVAIGASRGSGSGGGGSRGAGGGSGSGGSGGGGDEDEGESEVERSVYLDHSVSTMHEGAFRDGSFDATLATGWRGGGGGGGRGVRGGSDSSGDEVAGGSSSDGGSSGGGGGRGGGRCPFGHGAAAGAQ